jgi:hypothetical protein
MTGFVLAAIAVLAWGVMANATSVFAQTYCCAPPTCAKDHKCQGLQGFLGEDLFKRLDQLGPNAKAQNIFKSGTFDAPGAK